MTSKSPKSSSESQKLATHLQKYLTYLKVEKNCSPSTLYSYRIELEKLLFYLDMIVSKLSDVKVATIRDYIYQVTETRNLSPNSMYKIISIFKSFFNFLEETEIIEINPTRKVKLPMKTKPIPRAVTEEDFEKLIYCLKYSPRRCKKNYVRDKLIFYMLYYCGLRRSELLNLNWDDIDLGKEWLVVRSSKNKNDRIIPLHPKVKELLDQYLEQRLPLENIALMTGEKIKRLSITSFNNLINMRLVISGIKKKGYTSHSFRHSFATRLVEKNVNIFMVQRLMGHLCLDSTKIYVHFNGEDYKKAINYL